MKKKEFKKLIKLIDTIEDLEDKRLVCQKFSDLGKCGINFNIVSDEEVESSFLQLKDMVLCLK